jgi:hypothetical protein
MAILNFNTNICNYTTKVVSKSAIPGSLSINNYEYVDLEMIPDSGYYLPIGNFSYEPNDYIDYVTFMQNGTNLRARAYLKQFDWPEQRTDVEVLVSGCAEKVITTTTTLAPTTTTTSTTTTTTIACPYISGYFINKNIIADRGENRTLKVYGIPTAAFTVIITDSAINTVQVSQATIQNTGSVDVILNIPRITSGTEQYTVTLSASQDCIMQLQTQPKAFKLFQGEDIQWKGDTFECCEEADVLLSTYCNGVDQYGTYTNGQCGTYNQLIQANSAACGYTTTTTTTTTTAAPTTTTTTSAPTTTTTTAGPTTTTTTPPPTTTTTTAAPPTTTTTAAPTTTTTTTAPTTTTTTTTAAPVSGTIDASTISAFTTGTSNTFDINVNVTSGANWILQFKGGCVGNGFTVSPSSGTGTSTNQLATISYDGDSNWTSSGSIELRRPVIDGGALLDSASIIYTP